MQEGPGKHSAPRPPPSQDGAAEFRAFLEQMGETQSGFARLMIKMGDDRKLGTLVRNVQRWANGEARLPGEMRIVMHLLRERRGRG